jgi:hypothetical protein
MSYLLTAVLIAAMALILAGCEPPAAPRAKPAAMSAPPPPPAAPGEIVTVTQEGDATIVRKKAKGPNFELSDAKGKYPLLVVFSASRSDQGYQKLRADWQAAQESVKAKNVRWVEVIGPPSDLTGQIEGGEALNFIACQYLWDYLGPSLSVTAIVLIGQDGTIVENKSRGGNFDLRTALEKL